MRPPTPKSVGSCRAEIIDSFLPFLACTDCSLSSLSSCRNAYGAIRSFVREYLSSEEGISHDEDKLLSALHEKVCLHRTSPRTDALDTHL